MSTRRVLRIVLLSGLAEVVVEALRELGGRDGWVSLGRVFCLFAVPSAGSRAGLESGVLWGSMKGGKRGMSFFVLEVSVHAEDISRPSRYRSHRP